MKIKLILSGGVHRLPDQKNVGRNKGILAPLDLQEIHIGHDCHHAAGDRPGEKQIPEQEVENGCKHDDGKPVERDQKRLMIKRAHRVEKRAGLDPDADQRDETGHAKTDQRRQERGEHPPRFSPVCFFCDPFHNRISCSF